MPPTNNIERRARRKKQTRLIFDPIDGAAIPSSSASASATSYSPAKVLYPVVPEMMRTPGKKSGGNKKGNAKLPFIALPTPVKSSQMQGTARSNEVINRESDDDDSDINPFPSSRRLRNSSPPVTNHEDRSRRNTGTHGKMGLDGASDTSEGSPPEDFEETPKSKKKTPRKKKATKLITMEDESQFEFKSEFDQPKVKSTRSFIKENSYSAPISSSERTTGRQSSSAVKNRRQKSVTLSDSEDELAAPLPVRRDTRGRGKKMSPAEETVSLEDDSDEIITTSPVKRSRPKPIVVEDDEDDEDSEEIVSPLKRRRQVTEEAESDSEASPSKRRRGASDAHKIPTRQTRQQKPRRRTAKEKTMELLRRRRAGEKIDGLTESESGSDEEKAGVYDTDSDMQALSKFEDESEGEMESRMPKPRRRNKQNTGDDEEDFIVDDDETIGVPTLGLHDIPLEFTHQSHKPLKEHFRDAVEWMIHNKINPAFSRDHPIYFAAFRKLDDEVRGYASSKYVSSVWAPDFSRAIWARPVYLERELDAPAVEMKCGACNRTNHPPKYAIQFQGKAYNKETLDEIEQESDNKDSDDSDDSDNESVNSKGQSIPGEEKEWYVGRFCRANAQTAHSLIHWKHALNEWVLGSLEGKGHLTPTKLAERDKMKNKQRKKQANEIVDEWEEEGIIKSLYGDFKRSLEAAREGKQERWGK